MGTIYEAVLHLPKPIRRVCIVSLHLLLSKKDWLNLKKNGVARFQKVQIAAFMGWFPYLFYSTTYVAEVMAKEVHHKPDIDRATRAGSLALLIYSFGTCCVFVYHHPLPTPLKKKKKNSRHHRWNTSPLPRRARSPTAQTHFGKTSRWGD